MKTIYCYYYNDMADFETVLVLHRLRCIGGRRIVAIAETMDPVTSQSGLRYLPDKTIAEAAAEEAEALIIPGGPINNRQNAILPLIRQMQTQRRLIAAICFGPQFLARAGVLDGVRYTTSCTPEHIAALGVHDPFPRANFVDQRVVEDGGVITAQGHAFVDFAAAVCRYLGAVTDPAQEWELFGKVKEDPHG
ncbi:MAG: DJ-1/PfpI family protein [Clostridia bacterium]|nr:DJ-1/PfpI family protein [Clostridia bacterium]